MTVSKEISGLVKENDIAIERILNSPNKTWLDIKKLDTYLSNRATLRNKIKREYVTKG